MSATLLFGKMPAHGDFVARGFDGQERDSLDQWLSTEMAQARSTFAEDFEQRFDSAPPWRFAWQDEAWTAGSVASSIDSAGRRFPLLVARRGVEAGEVNTAAEACEEAIYDAFAYGWSADELAGAVSTEAASGMEAEITNEGWWTLGNEEFPPGSVAGRQPTGLIRAMLEGLERAAA